LDKVSAQLLLGLVLVTQELINKLENVIRLFKQMLLKFNALRNDIATHSFFSELFLRFNNLIFLLAVLHFFQMGATRTNGLHKFGLEQVIKTVKCKTLVQQFEVYLFGEPHQTNCFVLYLGNQSTVFVVLRSNQLSNEVLAVDLCNHLALLVEDSDEVVMVLHPGHSYVERCDNF